MADETIINVLWAVDHLGFDERIHGAGMFYLNTIPAFDRSRFNVSLCVLRRRDSLHRYVVDRGITAVSYLGRSRYDPLTLFDFLKLLKRDRIDIMHLHGYGAQNFGRLAGMFSGVPTVIHVHDPSTYYPWFQKMADALLLRFGDTTLAVSDSIRSATAERRGIPIEQIHVVPTCIRTDEFKPLSRGEVEAGRRKLGIADDVKIVGTVTRLYEQKGNEYLIKAMPGILARFPKTVLVIMGDGPLRGELENLSRDLGVDESVLFAGHCDDVRSLLGTFDVKVLPSLWEGTPLTMLEAMAMGVPIVSTSIDGQKEVLEDGRTALLVPPGDPGALCEKICYLLEHEDEARALGERAEEASGDYDATSCAAKLGEFYVKLFESKVMTSSRSPVTAGNADVSRERREGADGG